MRPKRAPTALSVLAITAIAGAWLAACVQQTDSGTRTERGFVNTGGFFTETNESPAIPPTRIEEEEETNTESFFAARAIDPATEDSAGIKFVEWGDIDNDGLPDLATAWNQNQVVQIHLQRRDADDRVSFESVQIAGTTPIAIIAGLKLFDMDADGQLDIVLLVKHRGLIPTCPLNGEVLDDGFTGEVIILFGPAGNVTSGTAWSEVELVATREEFQAADGSILPPPGLPASGLFRAIDTPEIGGMTAMDVGDVNGDGMPDIVLTSNRPEDPCHNPFENDVELYLNPGPALARNGASTVGQEAQAPWNQTLVDRGANPLKHLLLFDIDDDNDLDIIFTRPDAASANIAWRENVGGTFLTRRPIGQIDGGADVMTLGDVDQDGFTDLVVRSNVGQVIQWFRHPSPDDDLNVDDVTPARPDIPWSVYTLIELVDSNPLGLDLGDINFDGKPEVILGADGRLLWLDSTTGASVFDVWSPNLIVDDTLAGSSLFAADSPGFINDVLVLDVDCDGANDVVATLDRRDNSGVSNDVLVWFRNVLLPEDIGIDEPLVPGCPTR